MALPAASHRPTRHPSRRRGTGYGSSSSRTRLRASPPSGSLRRQRTRRRSSRDRGSAPRPALAAGQRLPNVPPVLGRHPPVDANGRHPPDCPPTPSPSPAQTQPPLTPPSPATSSSGQARHKHGCLAPGSLPTPLRVRGTSCEWASIRLRTAPPRRRVRWRPVNCPAPRAATVHEAAPHPVLAERSPGPYVAARVQFHGYAGSLALSLAFFHISASRCGVTDILSRKAWLGSPGDEGMRHGRRESHRPTTRR